MAEWDSGLDASDEKAAWVPNCEPASAGERGDVRIEGILGCEGRGKNRRMHLETMCRWVVQEGWDAEDEEHETGNKKEEIKRKYLVILFGLLDGGWLKTATEADDQTVAGLKTNCFPVSCWASII